MQVPHEKAHQLLTQRSGEAFVGHGRERFKEDDGALVKPLVAQGL